MKCSGCKHRATEIPAALSQIAEKMRQFYSQVIYCQQLQTLVVSNPGRPPQDLEVCEKFEEQT